jgi:hypothetical protein
LTQPISVIATRSASNSLNVLKPTIFERDDITTKRIELKIIALQARDVKGSSWPSLGANSSAGAATSKIAAPQFGCVHGSSRTACMQPTCRRAGSTETASVQVRVVLMILTYSK